MLPAEDAVVPAKRASAQYVLLTLVVVGAGLRLWQYLANTASWLDEVAVIRNILDRSTWDLLTRPLAYDQVAPKGFLLVEKIATLLFGRSDYVLRFFPLASSLIGLIVFWRIVQRLLSGFGGPVAMALFALAGPLVVFGSEVKQYSSDVTAAILLLWLALDLRRPDLSAKRALWNGIAGAVLVWFSQSAVLVAVALSIPLVLYGWKEKRPVLVVTPSSWTVSALIATMSALGSMRPATQEYLRRYWASGFPPIPWSQEFGTLWPLERLTGLIGGGTGGDFANLMYPVPGFYLAAGVWGFWILWRRDRQSTLLLLAPILLTFAAAVSRQYPLSDRQILFLVPTFFLAIGAFAETIRRWAAALSPPLGALALLLIAGPAVYPIVKTPPVYHLDDMKPVLSYVRANRRPGDAVYVYYGAAPEMSLYAAEYGFREDEYSVGGCRRGDTRRYFDELDTFRGRPRAWILMTHALRTYRERSDLLGYLDAIGTRLDATAVESHLPNQPGGPAEAFLYDLSDPGRLAAATRNSAKVTGRSSRTSQLGCGEGPLAMVLSRGLALR